MNIAAAFVVFLMLVTTPAHARTVDGVPVPESLELAGGQAPLVLNGTGIRTRFFVKIYVAALYLPQRSTQGQRVLEDGAARVIAIHMRRDVSAERIGSALVESVAKNYAPAELAPLQDRLTQFKLLLPSMKRGDVLRLEFLADGSTRVVRNDQPLGALAGADFQRALLQIWVGENPADEDLKRGLLGVEE